MDAELKRSLLAASMLLVGLVCGYLARRAGVVKEQWSRPLHVFNIIAFQASTSLLSMWKVPLAVGLLWLPVSGLAISLALTLISLGIARLYRFNPRDRGTFALSCGMSNLGTTGGLIVIAVLLGKDAVPYGVFYLVYWTAFAFLFCFPLARHYGTEGRRSVARLVLDSVVDIRTIPFGAMMAGLAMNALHVPFAPFLSWVVYAFILASGFVAMFAIGITLHLRKVREFIGTYLTQAAVKYLIGPALALLLVTIIGFHGPDGGRMAKVVIIMGSMSQAFYSVMIANLFNLNVHMANSMFLVNTLTFLVVVFPALALLL